MSRVIHVTYCIRQCSLCCGFSRRDLVCVSVLYATMRVNCVC